MSNTRNYLLVAAIDIGTTYSGFAFSFLHEYRRDPLQVNAATWPFGNMGFNKTPTCVLFNPAKQFHSFGFDAEEKYEDLTTKNEHQNWYLFSRFKMELYNARVLERDFLLYDATGKSMKAITVFSAALSYLKTKTLNLFTERALHQVNDSGIGWVITVPSIWTDASKQFMREAAENAGFPEENIILALEPEAASLLYEPHMDNGWMKWLSSFIWDRNPGMFTKGSKYMIIDAGGGTVDITVHEVIDYQYVKEIHEATGGPWGGTTVDDRFYDLLSDLVGRECFQSFRNSESYDYLDLMREFERMKRTVKLADDHNKRIRIPPSLDNACKRENGEICMKDMIQIRQLQNRLAIIADKLILTPDSVLQLFTDTIDKITNHITDLLRKPEVNAISTIVMVGGFSECEILKSSIQATFPDKKVVIPNDAGLAVLKGAVMFGHNSSTIKERISRFSYGVRITTPFNHRKHDRSKRVFIDNKERCDYIFSKHVEVGQSVKIGHSLKSESYTPANAKQKTIYINVYASKEKNPVYVTDESCHMLGSICVDLSELPNENKRVNVAMIFGRTELQVKATSENGKELKAKFDYFQ